MRAPVVIFRADAGSSIGVGHLRRCSILAAEVIRNGGNVRLVTAPLAGARASAALWPYAITWLAEISHEPDEITDAELTMAAAGEASPETWFVVDHQALSENWERRMRRGGHRVLAFDDSRDRTHHADIVVSDAPPAFDSSLNSVDDGACLLAGFEYALVERRFTSDPSTRPAGAKHLLISYGGSDPTRETLKAIEAIRILQSSGSAAKLLGNVEIVIGPANLERQRIEAAVDGLAGASVDYAPTSLAPHVQRADIVLTAGGNSLVEALVSRKPPIVTTTARNQELMVNALEHDELVVSLGRHDRVQPHDIAGALERVLAEYDSFVARVHERSPFDHRGAERIVAAMLSFPPLLN